MAERWKWVPGYEGKYQVSDLGRVKSFVKSPEGKLLRPGTMNRFGHCSVALGRGNSKCVHALVLLAFVAPVPKGKESLHENGIGSDNKLNNLRYGTRSENNIDSAKLGRRKLNPEKIALMLAAFKLKSQAQVAREFGITRATANKIFHRKLWAHV